MPGGRNAGDLSTRKWQKWSKWLGEGGEGSRGQRGYKGEGQQPPSRGAQERVHPAEAGGSRGAPIPAELRTQLPSLHLRVI